MGLEKTGNNWRWIGETKDTSDPEFGYQNTEANPEQDCTVHYYDSWFYSFWGRTLCTNKNLFICQKKITDTFCGSKGEICYYRRMHDKVTQSEAHIACMAEGLMLMPSSALTNSTSGILAFIKDSGCHTHFWLDDEPDKMGKYVYCIGKSLFIVD